MANPVFKLQGSDEMFNNVLNNILKHQSVKSVEYYPNNGIMIQFYEGTKSEDSEDSTKAIIKNFETPESPQKIRIKEKIINIKDMPKLNFNAWDFRKGLFGDEAICKNVLYLFKTDLTNDTFWDSYERIMKSQKKEISSGVESALNKIYTKFNCDKSKFYNFIEIVINEFINNMLTTKEIIDKYKDIVNNNKIDVPLLYTGISKLSTYYKLNYLLMSSMETQQKYLDMYNK